MRSSTQRHFRISNFKFQISNLKFALRVSLFNPFLFVLAVCGLLLAAPAGGARRVEYASTPEGRLRIFDEVWEQVSERYFDPSFHGVDWTSLRAELRPRAAEAPGEAELYALLRQMLGRLRDPHTRVYAPGESTDWRVHRYVSVGVAVRELAGQVVVTDVERDSQARRAGLRAGDAVLALDGV